MKKKFLRYALFGGIIAGLLSFGACSSDNTIDNPEAPETPVSDLEFTLGDLQDLATRMETEGYESEAINTIMDEIQTETPETRSYACLVTTKKISISIPNPSEGMKKSNINISGILMYPKLHCLKKKMKLIVAAPGTYTDNAIAPSMVFKDLWSWKSCVVFNPKIALIAPYLLNAVCHPVLLVDYPGFGDSKGQIQHPYLDQKILAETTVLLTREAQKVLKQNGVRLASDELILAGYSQGAFVATSTARAIETNPANSDLKVRMVTVGGIPAYLSKILAIAVAKNTSDLPFFFPYALWGYKDNRYIDIPVNKIMKEPYYTISMYDFKGDGNKDYPKTMSDMYTADFLQTYTYNPVYSELVRALADNDIKPWANKFPLFMFHGTSDTTVDYSQAEQFAKDQIAKGGNVTFTALRKYNHAKGFTPYWSKSTCLFAKW